MIKPLIGILVLFFSLAAAPSWAKTSGETMFEGYYKIELAKKPVGYTIVRYSYDPKAHTFESISFLRTNIDNQVYQESTKEKCNDKFQPISYQYTSQSGSTVKTIDASFKNSIMTTVISDGKKTHKQTSRLPKGTFLSSFLPYLMLQKKLHVNEAFRYSGIAEEDGNSYWGDALLESLNSNDRYQTFKIVNTFKGENFVSEMAVTPDPNEKGKYQKGEVLLTYSTVKNLRVELVATPAEATKGHLVPNKTLITLFGRVPLGQDNMVSRPPDPMPKMIPSPVPPKKKGG